MHAVTGIRDVHVVPAEERSRVYSRDSLFLDVGAKDEAEGRRASASAPGDPVVPDAPFTVMNGTNNYLAKAWDDRVGCGVIVEAMRRLAALPHANQIVWTITTQEESRPARRTHAPQPTSSSRSWRWQSKGGSPGDVFPRAGGRKRRAKLGAGPGAVSLRFIGAAQSQAGAAGEADRRRQEPAAATRFRAGLR